MKTEIALILLVSLVLPLPLVSGQMAGFDCQVEFDIYDEKGTPLEAMFNLWVDHDWDGIQDTSETGTEHDSIIEVVVPVGAFMRWSIYTSGYLPKFGQAEASDSEINKFSCSLTPCSPAHIELYFEWESLTDANLILNIVSEGHFGIQQETLVGTSGLYTSPILGLWFPVSALYFYDDENIRAWGSGVDYELVVLALDPVIGCSSQTWRLGVMRPEFPIYAEVLEGVSLDSWTGLVTPDCCFPPSGLVPLNLTILEGFSWTTVEYQAARSVPSLSWPILDASYVGGYESIDDRESYPIPDDFWVWPEAFVLPVCLLFLGSVILLWLELTRPQGSKVKRKPSHIWKDLLLGNMTYRICERCGKTEREVIVWQRTTAEEMVRAFLEERWQEELTRRHYKGGCQD